ncbi:hypothetical protein WMF31_24380 [Sorangium sp. So ce1036]|uniref:hypothetical protein n=1 Tax=Sorangium sp. So ce1036 TaxID=3133328 RepID=UPI003F01D0E8
MLKHPTISAWQRDHEGGYQAEIRGWTLRVRWIPERPGELRGFVWEAEGPEGKKITSSEVHEEIEVAMANAEECVAPDPEKHEGKTVD